MELIKGWNKQEALYLAQKTWERANVHERYIKWRKNHIEAQRFYDGRDVFLGDDMRQLQRLNLLGISANMVAPIIDNLTGVETQSRYRLKAEVDSFSEEATRLAAALSSFLVKVQEDQNSDAENSMALRDGCIGGLGWLSVLQHDNRTLIERIHPLEIIPDFDDISPHFTQMEYVFRVLYMSAEEIKARWKGKANALNFTSFSSREGISPAVRNLTNVIPTFTSEGTMNCVCEMQFKVPKKAFCGVSRDGKYFETFDYEKAEDIVESKNELEEIDSKEIRRILFCQNTVLEYSPLSPSYPNQQDFSYIPFVYKKSGENVPYGMVENLKAMQIDLNARLTKMVRSYNAEKTFIKNAKKSTMETIRDRKDKYTDPNAVIALDQGEEVVFSKATETGDNQMKMVDTYLNLIKRSSGVEDESFGRETNATSGISQRIREATSLRTNAFIFDSFSLFKKRQGLQLINMIKNSFFTNILTIVQEEEDKEQFILNFTAEDPSGNIIVQNDISFMPFTIVVEEIPTFKTSLDARRLSLETIASLPFGELVWMSEDLLRLYTDKPKKLKEEIMATRRELAMLQNPQAMQQAQGAVDPNQTQPTNVTQGALENVGI